MGEIHWLSSAERDILRRIREMLQPEEWVELPRLLQEFHRRDRLEADAIRQLMETLSAAFQSDFLGADALLASSPHADLLADDEYRRLKSHFVQGWANQVLDGPLDEEQAGAVAVTTGDALVVARAGSGKTRTLVAKALFLQQHCGVGPRELLLLAFNKKAAQEMEERLSKALRTSLPHVMTFHALAHAVVHPDENLVFDDLVADQMLQSREIQEVIDEHIRSPRYRDQIRELMLAHFREDWERIADGRIEMKMDDYLAHRRALPRETLRGEYVKSFGEKTIANAMFEHGIRYEYERNHRWNGVNYRPDFTLAATATSGLVIEYFGMAGESDYDMMSDAKREYWRRKQDWALLEYSAQDLARLGVQGFIARLLEDLRERGLKPVRRSDEDIWQEIRQRAIDQFTSAMRTFVARCRKRNLDSKSLARMIAAHSPESDAESRFFGLGLSIYEGYLRRLAAHHKEDFDGLIWRAVERVRGGQTRFVRRRGSEQGDLGKIRFVLMDEFQDFTQGFFELVDAIRRVNPLVQFFCVGDDWQAINAFAGSELRFFEEFQKFFSGPIKVALHVNYRSAAQVVEVGNALMQTQGEPAVAHRAGTGSVWLCDLQTFSPSLIEQARHGGDEITPAVVRITGRLVADGKRVVLLSRRNAVPWYVGSRMESARTSDRLQGFVEHVRSFLREEDRDRVTISTAHRYKGREQDAVVVLDAVEGSYPLIHPSWQFLRMFGDSLERLRDEERRLFYVALTRARDSLIVVTDSSRTSSFVEEIVAHRAVSNLEWEDFPPIPSLEERQVEVCVYDAYEVRDLLKDRGFRWEPTRKYWYRTYAAAGFSMDLLKGEQWLRGSARVVVYSETGERLH